MTNYNQDSNLKLRVLATDLDGTLIPLPGTLDNIGDLAALHSAHSSGQLEIVFATGRHFESVLGAIKEYRLPEPDWLICDVGSSIYQRKGETYQHYAPFSGHLAELTQHYAPELIHTTLDNLEGLHLQPKEHQQHYKISYQCTVTDLDTLTHEVENRLKQKALPYDCVSSVDPFDNRGLIDVLPKDVSKAYALQWLAKHADFHPNEVVYAGDSGNDFAALTCGFHAIVVANAREGLAEKVRDTLGDAGMPSRFFHASKEASSGVLEGCKHFGIFPQ